MESYTQIQNIVVNELEKRGFRLDKIISGMNPETSAALLSKKVKFSTYYAEVESDGSVNGGTLARFLSTLPGRK